MRTDKQSGERKEIVILLLNSCSAQVIGVVQHDHHRAAIDLSPLPCGSVGINRKMKIIFHSLLLP